MGEISQIEAAARHFAGLSEADFPAGARQSRRVLHRIVHAVTAENGEHPRMVARANDLADNAAGIPALPMLEDGANEVRLVRFRPYGTDVISR